MEKNTLKNILKNNRGVSLIEVVISMGIVGVAVTLYIGANRSTSDLASRAETQTVLQKNIVNYVESISSDVGFYQVNYNNQEDFDNINDPDQLMDILPIAWNKNIIASVEECPTCRGRMGYSISPLEGQYRGLFTLRFKVLHPDLNGGNVLEYVYLINRK